MAVSTYSDLKTAIADWLARSDLTTVIDDFIDLAEARIYGDTELRRLQALETALSGTIASGTLSVPSDYLELKTAYILSGGQSYILERKATEWIFANYPNRSADSMPHYIGRDGSSFVFGPYPDSGYTVNGTYFAKLTALSTGNETNWFTTDAPDLLLFGALLESAPYLGQDNRLALWAARWKAAKDRIIEAEQNEAWSGGPLMMTAV